MLKFIMGLVIGIGLVVVYMVMVGDLNINLQMSSSGLSW